MAPGMLLVVALLGLVAPTLTAAEIMAGRLTGVKGNVEVQKRGAEEWTAATDGMEIQPGDRINAGFNGRAVLEFENSRTEIRPVTQFVVGRAFTTNDLHYTELFLQVGKVLSEVNPNNGKQNRFNVTSPVAVAGVRGTKQEVRFAPAVGMDVKIHEGHGVVSPVSADKLPPAVQQLLQIAPKGGNRAGGVAELREEGGKGGKTDVATPKEAVEAFNEWIQDAAGGAAGENAGVLDAQTFEYSIPVSEGQSASVVSSIDPSAVVDAAQTLAKEAVADVTPAGLSSKEEEATAKYTEALTTTVSETQKQEQSALNQVTIQENIQSTQSGGTPPTATNLPPARPQ